LFELIQILIDSRMTGQLSLLKSSTC